MNALSSGFWRGGCNKFWLSRYLLAKAHILTELFLKQLA